MNSNNNSNFWNIFYSKHIIVNGFKIFLKVTIIYYTAFLLLIEIEILPQHYKVILIILRILLYYSVEIK